jgi:hypothetical protein
MSRVQPGGGAVKHARPGRRISVAPVRRVTTMRSALRTVLPPLFAEDYEASALRYNVEYQPASRHCMRLPGKFLGNSKLPPL